MSPPPPEILHLQASELQALRRALAAHTGPATPLTALATLLLTPSSAHPPPGEVAALFTSALAPPHASLPGLCALAHVFTTHATLPISRPRAALLYARCASANACPLARLCLADALRDAAGVARDVPEAARLYALVARETRSNVARVRLARLLEDGTDGLPRDAPRAVRLYRDAIRDGACVDAMEFLAELFVDGREGVAASPREAVRLYEDVIRCGGGTRAMNSLAVLLETGAEGVPRDSQRAVALFERAVLEGSDEAMANLAFLLARGGDGVERDMARSVSLYECAVRQGNKFAMRNLAHMIVSGDEAVEQDLYRAMKMYEEVREDGRYACGRVKVNLAWLLSCHQDELPQDIVRAVSLYEEVIAEEINACAMYNLAGLLAEGRGGVKRDVDRAVELYQNAIDEENDAFSMHNLGLLLSSDTEGIEKDMPRAIELLEMAAEHGIREAEFDLALILTGGDSDRAIDLERGMRLYEELILDVDHMGAIINLSELYGEGKHGLTRDIQKAIQLSERAIAIGLGNDEELLLELGIPVEGREALGEDVESVEIREQAVTQRWHLVAMCNLAELLLLSDAPKNLDRATGLVLRAFSDPRASRALRSLTLTDLLHGLKRGVEESGGNSLLNAKAAAVFEMIVGRIGNTQAMCLLADMLLEGREGIPRDVKKAVNLYKRAIFNNDPRAMLSLGEVLSDGVPGVDVDRWAAAELFFDILRQDSGCAEASGAVVNLALLFRRRR